MNYCTFVIHLQQNQQIVLLQEILGIENELII